MSIPSSKTAKYRIATSLGGLSSIRLASSVRRTVGKSPAMSSISGTDNTEAPRRLPTALQRLPRPAPDLRSPAKSYSYPGAAGMGARGRLRGRERRGTRKLQAAEAAVLAGRQGTSFQAKRELPSFFIPCPSRRFHHRFLPLLAEMLSAAAPHWSKEPFHLELEGVTPPAWRYSRVR